jgi:hypothetical protein
VAEGLGGGLQMLVWCGDPFMPVRVRPPTLKVFVGVAMCLPLEHASSII